MLSMKEDEGLIEGFDLPEDLVVKILCRLPVRTLIRFISVSKRWRFIILSDPQFANSHLQLASEQRTLTRRLFVTNYGVVLKNRGDRLTLQSWKDSLNGSVTSVIDLISPSQEPKQRVITSCNGLVLLGDSYLTDMVCLSIWNPSTGFLRKIPSPRMTEIIDEKGERKYLEFLVSGFGYVSATDDYKLVFVIPGDMAHFHVYIFSLRANCWKVIKAPHLTSSPRCHHEVGTLSNEAIHWINCHHKASMYAFDLAEEEFREIKLPVWFPSNDTYMRVVVGGCLCVWFKSTDDRRGSEFWGMREYGVPASWVKLFGFREYDLPDVFASLNYDWGGWDLCYVTEGGAVVIKLFDSNELVRIECRKEDKPVCSGRYLLEDVPGSRHYYNRTSYVETLVSVPE